MCLKTDNLEETTKKNCNEIQDTLTNVKLEEKLLNYEVIRLQSNLNMFLNPFARQLTGLTKEDYDYILRNYDKLMKKFPRVRNRAMKKIDYVTSATISRMITLKGCKTCIGVVSNKLDVAKNDLCENCKTVLTEHKL